MGVFIGPSEAVLDGLGPHNLENLYVFSDFVGFPYFEALDNLLGSILAFSWADLGLKLLQGL